MLGLGLDVIAQSSGLAGESGGVCRRQIANPEIEPGEQAGRAEAASGLETRKHGVLREVPGEGVGMGRDHTIFATAEGRVTFKKGLKGRTFISVLPVAEAAE